MFTIAIGALGAVASFLIGIGYFGFSAADVALEVLAANVASIVAGSLTLQAEKVSWIKAWIIPGAFRTWALLSILFFGIMLAIAEPLRSFEVCLKMGFPLILSTGLNLPWAFGPIQDWIVRRGQRKLRKTRVASSAS